MNLGIVQDVKAMFMEQCEKAGFKPNIVSISDSILLNILWAKQESAWHWCPSLTRD